MTPFFLFYFDNLHPTEVSFVNCQLCPREGCPARKAPFEKELHDNKYSLANH